MNCMLGPVSWMREITGVHSGFAREVLFLALPRGPVRHHTNAHPANASHTGSSLFRAGFLLYDETFLAAPRIYGHDASSGCCALIACSCLDGMAGVDQIALCRLLTDSRGRAPGKRRVRISRMGGWPKRRLYSRLNWLGLS